MTKAELISKEVFESHRLELEKHYTANTLRLAELVLVDGRSNAEAASITGTTRQNVSKTVDRVRARISGHPSSWVRVDGIWAPPDLAAEFKEKVRRAKEETPR